MLEKRKLLKKYINCLNEMKRELNKRKLSKTLNGYMEALDELQCEVAKRESKAAEEAQATTMSTCPSLPHHKMLDEYITTYRELDDNARELLDAALDVRHNAYVPYTKFRVGAAFRSKCGVVYAGCNVENVALAPGFCAERTALAKGVSEGVQRFSAGAVVALHRSGFVTPCGVCRQFILEFAKADIPLFIAKAPEKDGTIPPFGDDDEVLVTSIYNLMPHSFTAFEIGEL